MTSIELVVARHLEDLRWLRRTPKSLRLTVYDKGGTPAGLPERFRGTMSPLPNVGREAHTYLHHLVHRYDTLADVTVFCQGKPFDNVPELHRFLRALAENRRRVADFLWLGFLIDWDDTNGERLFRVWSKNPEGHPLLMTPFWRSLWDEPVPARFIFYPGAHFAVTAAQVRSRPKTFYERALTLSATHPEAAHCFERCWDKVFGVAGIPAEWRHRDLPLYLKPIRRLQAPEKSVPSSPETSAFIRAS